MLYKSRSEAINCYDNYSSMISEAKAKTKATKGTRLKIDT